MTFLGVPIRFCLFPCVSFCLLYTGYDDDSRDCWKRVLETFETRFPATKELSNLSSNLSSNPGDLPEFLRYFLVSPIWKSTVDWLLQGASLEHPAVLKRKRLGRGQSRAVVKDMKRGSIDQRNIWKMGLGKIIWYINIITHMGFDTFITIPWFSWYWW